MKIVKVDESHWKVITSKGEFTISMSAWGDPYPMGDRFWPSRPGGQSIGQYGGYESLEAAKGAIALELLKDE
jgi:hypothetical protein